MKREVTSILFCVVAALWSCKDDSADDNSNAPSNPDASSTQTPTDPQGDPQPGVECSHPGAGKPIGGDRCECTTTRNIAGEWSTLRTCREGTACTTRDKSEALVITQDGTKVKADRGDVYSVTGTLCGDVVVWNGGTKDGLNAECGTFRLTDDTHYLADWCFNAAGQCMRTHGEGCPSQKGQCTGTGAKAPESAGAIKKLLCD